MQHHIQAIIDDLTAQPPLASNGARWEYVADTVMGGVSDGTMMYETVLGRPAIVLRGTVSLENNGGFIQLALNLSADGAPIDASRWTGIALDVVGNDQTYNLHVRTSDLKRPWQSYRQSFIAGPSWQTQTIPFADCVPHRTEVPLDTRKVRRIGLVAIGRAFQADLAIGGLRFY